MDGIIPPTAPMHGRTLLTRRRVGYLITGGVIISAAAVARLMDDERSVSIAQANQFIQQSGERLIAVLDGPGEPAEKRRQLQAVVGETMDVDGIARFAMGRFWNTASATQRSEYVRIFPTVLLTNLGKSFGVYQGVRFSIDRSKQVDDTVQVSTTVFRPGAPMQQITWVIGTVGSALKVVDIIAAGASMRIMQREDCASFMAHGNNDVDTLLDTLRRQAQVTS